MATAILVTDAVAPLTPCACARLAMSSRNATAKLNIGDSTPDRMQMISPRTKLPVFCGAAAWRSAPAFEHSATPRITIARPRNSSRPRPEKSWSGCCTAIGMMDPRAAISDIMMAKPSAVPNSATPNPKNTEPIPQPMPNTAASRRERAPAAE